MQRHSEEGGKTKKERNQDKCMSRCEDSPEYKRMQEDVRDKDYKELHRDVRDTWEINRF